MRGRRRWRWWAIAAAAAVALLSVSGATAFAATPGSVAPHRLVYGYAVTNADVWGDRIGDSVWCSTLGVGCGDPPQRPVDTADVPVSTLAQGEQVRIECWRGSYYLIDYDDVGHLGWAVADLAVRPLPSDGEPNQCTLLDDVT